MKRLKFSCLFGGKVYPGYLLLISLVGGLNLGITGIFSPMISALLILSPVIVFAVCYWVENRLTAGERKLIADTSYPLWQPVTPEIKTQIIKRQNGTQMTLPQRLIACVLCAGVVFGLGMVPPRGSHRMWNDPAVVLGIAILCAIVLFLCLTAAKGIGASWMGIDDSAVFTKIPIDHMYDVTHHGKRGTWINSYLVFYLPDGRYVLRVPKGSGCGNTVTVVKYHGAVTWFVADEHHPEDFFT